MHRQKGDGLGFTRVTHVDDGCAAAEGMRDIRVSLVDHDLNAVGTAALVGITKKLDILRSVRACSAHDCVFMLTRSACPSASIIAARLRAACQAMFCTPFQ